MSAKLTNSERQILKAIHAEVLQAEKGCDYWYGKYLWFDTAGMSTHAQSSARKHRETCARLAALQCIEKQVKQILKEKGGVKDEPERTGSKSNSETESV